MKKILPILVVTLVASLMMFILLSCDDPGVTSKELDGSEQNLPDVLKGMEVYSVSLGEGDYVKVAILNGVVLSSTYSEGKTTETTIMVNQPEQRVIVVKEIISENDSILVIRK